MHSGLKEVVPSAYFFCEIYYLSSLFTMWIEDTFARVKKYSSKIDIISLAYSYLCTFNGKKSYDEAKSKTSAPSRGVDDNNIVVVLCVAPFTRGCLPAR